MMSAVFTGGVTANNLFRISKRDGNFKSDYYLHKRQVVGIEIYEQTPYPTSFSMTIDYRYIGRRGGSQINLTDRSVANMFMRWYEGNNVFEEG